MATRGKSEDGHIKDREEDERERRCERTSACSGYRTSCGMGHEMAAKRWHWLHMLLYGNLGPCGLLGFQTPEISGSI